MEVAFDKARRYPSTTSIDDVRVGRNGWRDDGDAPVSDADIGGAGCNGAAAGIADNEVHSDG